MVSWLLFFAFSSIGSHWHIYAHILRTGLIIVPLTYRRPLHLILYHSPSYSLIAIDKHCSYYDLHDLRTERTLGEGRSIPSFPAVQEWFWLMPDLPQNIITIPAQFWQAPRTIDHHIAIGLLRR